MTKWKLQVHIVQFTRGWGTLMLCSYPLMVQQEQNASTGKNGEGECGQVGVAVCLKSVEDMVMLTGKEKNRATLRDQSALHYWVCSLWTLKKALQWFKSPCLHPTEVSYSHRCFLRQLWHSMSWLKHKTVFITFIFGSVWVIASSLTLLLSHWQWLPFYFSLTSSLSFFLFCFSCLLLPTVYLCRSLHLWVYLFFHHRDKPVHRFQSLFKFAFAY